MVTDTSAKFTNGTNGGPLCGGGGGRVTVCVFVYVDSWERSKTGLYDPVDLVDLVPLLEGSLMVGKVEQKDMVLVLGPWVDSKY